jgi:hypothetical protein
MLGVHPFPSSAYCGGAAGADGAGALGSGVAGGAAGGGALGGGAVSALGGGASFSFGPLSVHLLFSVFQLHSLFAVQAASFSPLQMESALDSLEESSHAVRRSTEKATAVSRVYIGTPSPGYCHKLKPRRANIVPAKSAGPRVERRKPQPPGEARLRPAAAKPFRAESRRGARDGGADCGE